MTENPSADSPATSSLGTPAHFRWLHGIVKAILALNLADAVFTLIWVDAGLAEEANPVLRTLVHDDPVLFVIAKLGVVGALSLLLWHGRNRPLAILGIFVVFIAYYGILLFHLSYLSWISGDLLGLSG